MKKEVAELEGQRHRAAAEAETLRSESEALRSSESQEAERLSRSFAQLKSEVR